MKAKKPKLYKHYTSMLWAEDGIKYSMLTQLYEAIGAIYVTIYAANRIDSQLGADPVTFGTAQRKLIARLRAKGIEVTLGPEKTIFERSTDGYWVEYTGE